MKTESYMIAVPRRQEDLDDVEGLLNRLSQAKGIQILSHELEERLVLTLLVDDIKYKVEMIPAEFEIPEMFRTKHFFEDVDIETVKKAEAGLAVSMKFGEDALNSYHAQLKIMTAMLPDMVAVLDADAENILSGKWVQLAAASDVPPAPRYIYTVQAVSGENERVWLHSHGLNRCGLPELEILNSDREMYREHYNIIETMANRLLEFEREVQVKEPIFIAWVTEEIPMYATLVDWQEATSHYKAELVGGKNDRLDDNNESTCCIFAYPSQEALENKKYAPVMIYNQYLKGDPVYAVSDKETGRMKRQAYERLPYLFKAAESSENKILVKIGLDVDEEYREEQGDFEHIWFELLEITEKEIRGKLTQEPYYVKNMREGREGKFSLERITDWIIYTKERRITPDDVYLLI